MNRISGRVVLKESGAGVPDVLVVIYDLDPGTKTEESIASTASLAVPPESLSGGDRLGSVLTARDGSFELSYEDSEFQIRNSNERRPDLVLQVLGPEEPGQAVEARVLYVSRTVRQNAGKTEQCLIRITAEQLTKAGIEAPSLVAEDDAEPAQGRVQRLKAAHTRSAAIADGTLEVARDRVDTHRVRFQGFSAKLHSALSTSLSTVPVAQLQPDRFVKQGESPFTKNSVVIQRNIRDVVNSNDPSTRAPVNGFISLTADEAQQLQSQVASDGTVPESAVIAVAGSQPNITFLQRTDLLPLCRSKPRPLTDA